VIAARVVSGLRDQPWRDGRGDHPAFGRSGASVFALGDPPGSCNGV